MLHHIQHYVYANSSQAPTVEDLESSLCFSCKIFLGFKISSKEILHKCTRSSKCSVSLISVIKIPSSYKLNWHICEELSSIFSFPFIYSSLGGKCFKHISFMLLSLPFLTSKKEKNVQVSYFRLILLPNSF